MRAERRASLPQGNEICQFLWALDMSFRFMVIMPGSFPQLDSDLLQITSKSYSLRLLASKAFLHRTETVEANYSWKVTFFALSFQRTRFCGGGQSDDTAQFPARLKRTAVYDSSQFRHRFIIPSTVVNSAL